MKSGKETPGFNQAWSAVARPYQGETVSAELRPLLGEVYRCVLSDLLNLSRMRTVGLFFSRSEGWQRDWTEVDLPEDFHDVLALMGEALHDTVKNPEIAKNFGRLPEQLLERVKHLKT